MNKPNDNRMNVSAVVNTAVLATPPSTPERQSVELKNRKPTAAPELMQFHNFTSATFSKPTYCDLCSNFIWGIVKQGFTCEDCGYNSHKKCQALVMTPCNPAHAHSPRPRPFISSASRGPVSLKRSNSVGDKNSIVTELFAETQVQTRRLEKALKEANPELNMSLFLKQNNRYTARQKPLIWLNETIIKLLTWHSVPNTMIFLLCYTLICLHPILLAILPQLVLLYLMVKLYHYRADYIMNQRSLPKPHIYGQPPKLSPTASEMKAAFQNIQNTMGQLSDVYDAGYNLYRMIDWSDPQTTQDILIKTVISMFGTLAIVSIVPINYIALVGGVGIFIANTAIFKAASLTLTPVLVKKLSRKVEDAKRIIQEARSKGTDCIIEMSVYENQRWWAGSF
jgi:hypothetical protein